MVFHFSNIVRNDDMQLTTGKDVVSPPAAAKKPVEVSVPIASVFGSHL